MFDDIAAVDPGLRACGVAIVDTDGRLVRAALIKNPEREDDGAKAWRAMALAVDEWIDAIARGGVDTLIVERQYVAPTARMKTMNPNQLIGLMAVVGGIVSVSTAANIVSIYPSQWKGSVKKEKSTRGIWAHLSPDERCRAAGAEKATGHNIIDAIGMAKWSHRKLAQLTLLK